MDVAVVGMALLIFVARVADVSLGTLRTAFIVRGKRAHAFGVGFIEILVWVMVVAQVITNLDRPVYVVAFALGFATGTVVGITVEGWFAIGEQVIRVFSTKGESVAAAIREQGFLVTTFAGKGRNGAVDLLFIKVPRRRTPAVVAAVRKLDPLCFYTVDDLRLASAAAARPGLLNQRAGSRSVEPDVVAATSAEGSTGATASSRAVPAEAATTASEN